MRTSTFPTTAVVAFATSFGLVVAASFGVLIHYILDEMRADEPPVQALAAASSEDLPIPPTDTTLEYAQPGSKLGEWVRKPSCPEGTQSHGVPVEARLGTWPIWTWTDFGDDGLASSVIVGARDNQRIEMVFQVTYVPAAAEGNPNGGSVPWAFYRYVPDSPRSRSVVLDATGPGFGATDRLQVCIGYDTP